MGMEFPETASRRLITPTAHQIAVGRDASPPQTAGFLCHRFLALECVEDDRNLDPCRALARRTATGIHLSQREAFQQRAKFLPLRNRGFGTLAVTILPVPFARRAAATARAGKLESRTARADSAVAVDSFFWLTAIKQNTSTSR
jgi:hypothetical protein